MYRFIEIIVGRLVGPNSLTKLSRSQGIVGRLVRPNSLTKISRSQGIVGRLVRPNSLMKISRSQTNLSVVREGVAKSNVPSREFAHKLLHLQVHKQSSIEHSENEIITRFENEVGPGMLQSSVQQTYIL